MGKPTVHDIAREAGVSLATVDRVLNQRPGVRDITARRVRQAIDKLGYVRDLYAADLARQKQYRFDFLLPEAQSQFLGSVQDALLEAQTGMMSDRATIKVHALDWRDPAAVLRARQRVDFDQADGVAIMANETPMVRDMISRLKDQGRSVVALVTDQPNSAREHFVGIDSRAAGRTAGRLMSRFTTRPGEIAVVVSAMQSRDMLERRLGFDETLATEGGRLRPLPSLEGHDDHKRTAEILDRCVELNPNIAGIYCASGGTRGITEVVRKHNLVGRVAVICHELTPHARDALENGWIDVVITQNPGHLVRSALRVLRAHCSGAPVIASQEKIRIEIVLKENLP
ncbi:MAG: LacI family DNA-binding transcriptional regulator [Pseudomonadota bacterium]